MLPWLSMLRRGWQQGGGPLGRPPPTRSRRWWWSSRSCSGRTSSTFFPDKGKGWCDGVQVVSLFGLWRTNWICGGGRVGSGLVNSRTQNPTATVWKTSQHIQYLELSNIRKSEASNHTEKGWNGTDLVIELVDGESDEEDEDGHEGDGHPPVPNVDRQVGQLRLQRGFSFWPTKAKITTTSPVGPTSPRHPHHLLRVHSEAGCWCSPPSSGSTGSPTHGSDEHSPPPPQGLEHDWVKLED